MALYSLTFKCKEKPEKKVVSEDYSSNILTTHISAVEKNDRTVKMFKENHHHKNKKQMLYIQLLLHDRKFS